ncbi:acylphosphatase-2 isoform X2 [Caretta caretta]|uniref:acylphosphatase-2 isoform X2 n=1 Tax=Caretta caretta TaxID=8467 RepID=UPI002095362F|nr:acylphosphatase-2 isoform X2 [Caretta caretta]
MPQRWGGARSPSSPHRAWAGSFGPGTDSAWHAAAFPRSLSRARCRPGPASRAQEVRAARPGSVGPGHSRSGSEQAGFLACTLPCPPSPRPPAPSSVCFRMMMSNNHMMWKFGLCSSDPTQASPPVLNLQQEHYNSKERQKLRKQEDTFHRVEIARIL